MGSGDACKRGGKDWVMKLSIFALGPAGYSPIVSTVMDYVKVVVLKYYIYKFEGKQDVGSSSGGACQGPWG
jgi:hypothetical protein